MSTGSFVNTRYEDGANGDIHPIRVQPETLTLDITGTTNPAPTGNINSERRAFVSSRRRRGAVCARLIGLKVTNSGPNEYLEGSTLYVPILRPTTYATLLGKLGQSGTYNGATVEVIGSSGERINP